MLIRKLGLGQQLISRLEADLVVDITTSVNEVGGDYFVLNKLVARKNKIEGLLCLFRSWLIIEGILKSTI